MNLENIVGCSASGPGQISTPYGMPSGFALNASGGICQGYNPCPVARLDSNGNVRAEYGSFTGIRLSQTTDSFYRPYGG